MNKLSINWNLPMKWPIILKNTCRAVTQKGRTIKLQDKSSLIHIPGVLFQMIHIMVQPSGVTTLTYRYVLSYTPPTCLACYILRLLCPVAASRTLLDPPFSRRLLRCLSRQRPPTDRFGCHDPAARYRCWLRRDGQHTRSILYIYPVSRQLSIW